MFGMQLPMPRGNPAFGSNRRCRLSLETPRVKKRDQSCQIFLGPIIPKWKNLPNDQKQYQTAIKNYIKWQYNIPHGHTTYQRFPFQGPPSDNHECDVSGGAIII
jgi:hypothetical protein